MSTSAAISNTHNLQCCVQGVDGSTPGLCLAGQPIMTPDWPSSNVSSERHPWRLPDCRPLRGPLRALAVVVSPFRPFRPLLPLLLHLRFLIAGSPGDNISNHATQDDPDLSQSSAYVVDVLPFSRLGPFFFSRASLQSTRFNSLSPPRPTSPFAIPRSVSTTCCIAITLYE